MSFFGGPEQVDIMTGKQKGLLNQMSDLLGQNVGQGIDAYGGQITPGATANQMGAWQGASNLFNDPRGIDPSAAQRQLLSGDPAFQIDPAQRERFYNDALVAPARASFRDTMQGIDQRYGAGFGESGSHRGAGYRAAEDFETGLMGKRAELLYADEMASRGAAEAGMGRMAQGVSMAPQLGQDYRANLGAMSQLGGEERSIAGQQLGEEYNKWQTEQDYNNPWLGFFGSTMSAQPFAIQNNPGMGGAVMSTLMPMVGGKTQGGW